MCDCSDCCQMWYVCDCSDLLYLFLHLQWPGSWPRGTCSVESKAMWLHFLAFCKQVRMKSDVVMKKFKLNNYRDAL